MPPFSGLRPFALQALLWTGLALLIVIGHSSLPSELMPAVFARVFVLALLFNVHQYVYTRFFMQRRYTLYAVLLTGALGAAGVAVQIFRAWSRPDVLSPWIVSDILREVLGYAVFLGVALGIYMFIRQLRYRYEVQEARALQSEAELRMLQAQINPHFLFNTMHSLYTLIELKSDKAQDVVLTLSDLMRYMAHTANAELVGLREEMENIERVLELQRIRFGARATIWFDITGTPDTWRIPPLLLLTLVENAFKHGIETTRSADRPSLRLSLDAGTEQLFFTVENTVGSPAPSSEKPVAATEAKTGLANVRRRLELLYPERHELTVADNDHFFSVNIRLWKTAPAL